MSSPFRRAPAFLIAAATLVVPAVVLAAGGHGEEHAGPSPIPWNDVIEGVVNFALFGFLLYYFAKRPLSAYLTNRHDTIAVQLDEARRLHREAEQTLEEYKHKLATFEQERDEVIEGYRREAEEDRDEIIEDAKRHAERLRADAKVAVEYELKRAQDDIRERIVDEALSMARDTLVKRLDKKTRDGLIDDYTKALADLQEQAPS